MPGLRIASFALNGFDSVVEVGTQVDDPAFLATYGSLLPDGVVTLDDGAGALSVGLPGQTFAYAQGGLPSRSYVKNLVFADPTQMRTVFTLIASMEASPRVPLPSAQVILEWQPRIYFGCAVPPSLSYDGAFIRALSDSALAPDAFRSIEFNPLDDTQKNYYAVPSAWVLPNADIHDHDTGIYVGVKKRTGIDVVNDLGLHVNYDLFESDFAGLGVVWDIFHLTVT